MRELKGQAEVVQNSSPSGTMTIKGKVEGTTEEILGGMELSMRGMKATIPTTIGDIPASIDKGAARISLAYSKGKKPESKFEISDGMVAKVLGHPISIKAIIDSLIEQKQLYFSATSINVPVARILKDILKDSPSKLLSGFNTV